jgi:hypothetical protein
MYRICARHDIDQFTELTKMITDKFAEMTKAIKELSARVAAIENHD